MSNARKVGSRTEIASKTNLSASYKSKELNKKIKHTYEANAINKKVNTETKINGNTISYLPAMNLRYSIANQNSNDSSLKTDQIKHSLRNGLWHAYLTALLFELSDKAHKNAVNLSNISEIFNNLSQNLTREIVSSSIKCNNKQIMIRENNLYLRCD